MHAQGTSIWDGVYSAAQADRGKTVYMAQCATCHGNPPEGTAMAPGLTGTDFMADFGESTMADLFSRVLKTMPAGSPGTLSGAEAADVIAFLGASNKWPAGAKDLPTDPEALKQIRIVKK